MGSRATNVPTPDGGRMTTSGQGPQQVGGFGGVQGLAPWLRQSTAPLTPMSMGNRPGLGSDVPPAMQQQMALAQQVSAAPAQTYQDWSAARSQYGTTDPVKQQALQSAYDQAVQQHQTMGGVTPDVYSQLTQTQREQLAVYAIQNPYQTPYDPGYSAGY